MINTSKRIQVNIDERIVEYLSKMSFFVYKYLFFLQNFGKRFHKWRKNVRNTKN